MTGATARPHPLARWGGPGGGDAQGQARAPARQGAGKAGGTIAAWEVEDLERTVDELTASGVGFEQVDSDRIKTNEKGIAELGDDRMAWFKDPDGNIHGLAQL